MPFEPRGRGDAARIGGVPDVTDPTPNQIPTFPADEAELRIGHADGQSSTVEGQSSTVDGQRLDAGDTTAGADRHDLTIARTTTRELHPRSGEPRELTARARLEAANLRDELARSRDLDALARDRAAAARDQAMAQQDAAEQRAVGRPDFGVEVLLRAAEARRRAAAFRIVAAEQRALAAADRAAAAVDRQRAAAERVQALADREALSQELAIARGDQLPGQPMPGERHP